MAYDLRHMADKQTNVGEQALRALSFLDFGPAAVEKPDHRDSARDVKGVTVVAVATHKGGQTHFTRIAKPKAKKTGKGKYFVLQFSDHNEPLLPGDAIRRLALKLYVDEKVVLDASRIPERTFHRRQEKQELLTATESDRVMRIARVGAEAGRVFGNDEKAARWLSKVNRMLGAKPLDLLASDAGSREVEAELQRIDWGDFA